MVFSSVLFLTVFLPLFLLGYFLLPKKLNVKHIFLLFASFLFYSWGEPKFVFAIFFTTLIEFYLVKKMDEYDNRTIRRALLSITVIINVGLLCYFKYFNFFIENANSLGSLFGYSLGDVYKVSLPIGISFYTFESITYSVDAYRRVHKPLDKFWEYQMYIIFFPKLIAGPIVRYHEIADQIQNHIENETIKNRLHGFIRFGVGLGKKVIIANAAGQQADAIFAIAPDHLNTPIAWVGALAYTMQIYFDFSGYSDMAIGISKMLGFQIPENFNNPYISKSVTEFWRRWHITLGNWMKNYLYIPLGGNKVSKSRVLMNLFTVFMLSGLWHGAGWNYIVWGVYYGLFLVIERLLVRNNPLKGVARYLGIVYTFLVVIVGWVLFRIENLPLALSFIKELFVFDFSNDYVFIYKPDFFFFFAMGLFFSFCAINKRVYQFQERFFQGILTKIETLYFTLLALGIYVLSLILLSGGQFNPFIYFKF